MRCARRLSLFFLMSVSAASFPTSLIETTSPSLLERRGLSGS